MQIELNHCQHDFAVIGSHNYICCAYHNDKWIEFIEDSENLGNRPCLEKYGMSIDEVRLWVRKVKERLALKQDVRIYWAYPEDIIVRKIESCDI